ncbi:MAG: hypothetical protein H6671_15960 [Anaerolineaceae bacterium]|nr:hypothetical protein [Anaerolineaceae bacterium]
MQLSDLFQPFTFIIRSRMTTQDKSVSTWGWMPFLALTSGAGLLMLGTAYSLSRSVGDMLSYVLYWSSLLMVFVPLAWRLLLSTPTRQERFILILILAISVYLIKALISPTAPYFGDEFTHWRNVRNILHSGHLFDYNSILPATGLYPGLQTVTAAVASLSGLPIFASGVIVVGVSRVLLVLSLFLFFEVITRSSRVAGIATMVYAGNPNFIFYGQQFGYESLSLPLAVFAVYMIVKRTDQYDVSTTRGLRWSALLAIMAVIPTHHMTSYALIVFLCFLTLMIYLNRRRTHWLEYPGELLERSIVWLSNRFRRLKRVGEWLLNWGEHTNGEEALRQISTGRFSLVTIGLTLFWLFTFASLTIGYLSPVLGGAINELFTFITGQSKAKEVFHSVRGQEIPTWERLMAIGAVGLVLLGTCVGIYHIWRRYPRNIFAMTMAMVGLAYPVTLVMRLTNAGAETANRSSEFLYLALGPVIALAIVELWLMRKPGFLRYLVAVGYLTVVFGGGLIAGMAWWARLPGTYLVAGDSRGIQPQGVMAAEWAATYLTDNNRVIGDSANRKLMGSYGQQEFVPGLSWLFFSPTFMESQIETLVKYHIDYIVIDYRITTDYSMNGIYFDSKEPDAGHHELPFDPRLLDKFDYIPNTSRIFHSGDIIIYDVTSISRQSGTP